MHRIAALTLAAIALHPIAGLGEYAGQGSFSPFVSISGADCQSIAADMSMTCRGQCDVGEIHLNVQNRSPHQRALEVELRVSGETLLNGGYTETHDIQVEPNGNYYGRITRLFTKADLAELDIKRCSAP